MGWQPGPGSWAGASPDRESGTPGDAPSARDPRLAVTGTGTGTDLVARIPGVMLPGLAPLRRDAHSSHTCRTSSSRW